MYFSEEEWDMQFITQADFFTHVQNTLLSMYSKKDISTLKKFNQNLVDPIKLTFDGFTNSLNKETLISTEIMRQVDKSMTNDIGKFHQDIFHFIEGWEVPTAGFDIENERDHIYVELKNKHNTMNSSSSQKTYMNMQKKLLADSNATCFLVEVIAKKSQNINWKVKLDGENYDHDKIRRVSIDKFYELATGDSNAFQKICSWLPIVIKIIKERITSDTAENKIIQELNQISDSFMNSLYLLSFESYIGFDNLEFKHLNELEEVPLFK
ncbi:Eco47II family restriction endonuclease [Listeria newyorkensis]|uniref:Eco47II family restriction endonuclease n=1 Tax=Listeria newyorkensis TaxID=1497681 RepID=A0A841YXC2_9LIST|nr:Eco47II family restriction endonuclease [Listeria newyorkensis]MBC1457313.1 Eco47II family restriction endonuclease [Listeria newyorkensis]